MEDIFDKVIAIQKYEIKTDINHVEWNKPEYGKIENRTYKFKNNTLWANLIETINKHKYIIDKDLEHDRIDLDTDLYYKYTSHSVIYTLNYKYLFKSSLAVGNFTHTNTNDIYATKKQVLFKDIDTINTIFDVLWVYDIHPIKNLEDKFLDKHIEQLRLERNIDKLKCLKNLKNGGDVFYLLTHMTVDATKDIIGILKYLFEKCLLVKPVFHDLTSTATYVFCHNFNENAYHEIKNNLDIEKFKKDGDISEIKKIGCHFKYNGKDVTKNLYKEIDSYTAKMDEIMKLVIKKNINTNELINVMAKYLYIFGVPIVPKFLDNKLDRYTNLYDLCVKNDIYHIFNDIDTSHVKKILEIYIHNKSIGIVYDHDVEYMKYDLFIVNKNTNIEHAISKISVGKYLYSIDENNVDKYIDEKVLKKIDNNLYQKISNISNTGITTIKLNDLNVVIYDTKKYSDNVIKKIFPIINSKEYDVYTLDGKTKKIEFYPYFPIYKDGEYYFNEIHVQMINKKNILGSISENIKIFLCDEMPRNMNRINGMTENFIRIDVKKGHLPYKETNHGWLSDGTKSNLYAVLKHYNPKLFIELGTWYGNSASYIKENSNCVLMCFDYYRTLFESEHTIRGDGIDKFYINYPRLESVYKRMQKYDNVSLIKGNAIASLSYLVESKLCPDVIFIDFIKNTNVLYNFLNEIVATYPKTIIIGDDYVFQDVKKGTKMFMNRMKNNYIMLYNIHSYILIPVILYNKKVKEIQENKFNELNGRRENDKYYICHKFLSEGNFNEAVKHITKNKLQLNKKSEYISNDGTIYHDFAYYYKNDKNFKKYLQILTNIEPVEEVMNNYDFTFSHMIKFDTQRLHSS